MIAMLFAAGLGTRMQDLTHNLPKALVPINGKSLLEHNLLNLKKQGIHKVVINVHHFADKITSFLKQHNNFGLEVMVSDETDLLRDTGGGLKYAKELLQDSENILALNVDILSNIDLNKMESHHLKEANLVTLAVRERESSRYLLFDQQNQLSGWRNTKTKQEIFCRNNVQDLSAYAFSGIQIIAKEALDLFPQKDVFGLIEFYLSIGSTNTLKAYLTNKDYWFDIGTPEKLAKAEDFLKEHKT